MIWFIKYKFQIKNRVVVLECKSDPISSLSHLYILAGHIDNTLQLT